MSNLLMEEFCLLTDRAFARFEVVGGFLVALGWIENKNLEFRTFTTISHPQPAAFSLTFLAVLGVSSSSELHLAAVFFLEAVRTIYLHLFFMSHRTTLLQLELKTKQWRFAGCPSIPQENSILHIGPLRIVFYKKETTIYVRFFTDFKRTAWSSATTLSTVAASSSLC